MCPKLCSVTRIQAYIQHTHCAGEAHSYCRQKPCKQMMVLKEGMSHIRGVSKAQR